MNRLLEHWFSYVMILIWLFLWCLCQNLDFSSRFANKGIEIISGEYYRYFTALFLHNNLLHVLVNAVGLYFVGQYLEQQISPVKLLVFSLLIGVITETIFSAIYKNSVSMGGSPVVFALIGMIIALHITKANSVTFQLGTLYGNWILGYAIFANIPIFSTSFISTLIIHGLPLGLGVLLGCVGICLRII